MHLTVLAVPGCPNVGLLEERLTQALDGRCDVTISRHVIADLDEAARRGMHGSPTILIDGINPFSELGQPASLSCRLYRDGHGQVDGAPSVGQLRQAIGDTAALPDAMTTASAPTATAGAIIRIRDMMDPPQAAPG